MKRSDEFIKFTEAMIQFHNEMEQPKKSVENKFFSSKYVPLVAVQDIVDEIGVPLGLTYMQDTVADETSNRVGVQTLVSHISGEWLESSVLWMPNEKNSAQGAGSAITYAKRYQLSALFGISSDEDDDGNSASGTGEEKKNEPMTLEKAKTTKITFGKHSGKLIAEIADDDSSYLNWLYKAEKTSPEIKQAIKMIADERKRTEG